MSFIVGGFMLAFISFCWMCLNMFRASTYRTRSVSMVIGGHLVGMAGLVLGSIFVALGLISVGIQLASNA